MKTRASMNRQNQGTWEKLTDPKPENQSQISIQGWSSQFAVNLFQTSDQIYLTPLR